MQSGRNTQPCAPRKEEDDMRGEQDSSCSGVGGNGYTREDEEDGSDDFFDSAGDTVGDPSRAASESGQSGAAREQSRWT